MGEVRDLLESDELKAVVAAIANFERLLPHPKSLQQGEFAKIALGRRLGADKIIQIILADPPYDPGVREILGAALAAWVLEPQYDKSWFDAMCRAAMRHMNEAEQRAGLMDHHWSIERDIIARYAYTGTEFLDDIYDGLGRYKTFLEVNPRETVRFMSEEIQPLISTIVRTIRYMHYAVDHFADDAVFHKPSLNRAVQIFAGLKQGDADFFKKFVSRSVLHERWSAGKDTLALLYAADSIHIGRSTLLSLIMDEKFSVHAHSGFLHRWFSRASYVGSHVFASATDGELETITGKLLKNIEPTPFSPKEFTSKEFLLVQTHYRKKKP